MNRFLMLLVFQLVGLALACDASACSRCGLFGNRCKFVSSHVAVAPVAVIKQPEVFVVQNNYPAANGAAALLSQQGNSLYGFQGAAQAYTLDPAAVLRQAADLARGAQQLAQSGVDGFNSSASLALQLNAHSNEPLARGTAAAMVLNAAGLNPQAITAPSQALRLYRDANGKWQVDNADPAAITARVEYGGTKQAQNTTAPAETPAVPPDASAVGATVAAKCAQCHGLAKSEPAAGLYLDVGHGIDCKQALKSIQAIMSGKMPKGQKLTPQELTSLVDELTRLASQE